MDRRSNPPRIRQTWLRRVFWFATAFMVWVLSSFGLWLYSAYQVSGLLKLSQTDVTSPSKIVDSLASASTHARRVSIFSDLTAIQLATHVPKIGDEISTARTLSHAAGKLSDVLATGATFGKSVYSTNAQDRLFSDGRINLELVEALIAKEPMLAAAINDADWILTHDECSGSLCSQVTDLHKKIEKSKTLLSILEQSMPAIPPALGRGKTSRFLITIGNEAELRASGGAPLSVALLEIDNGYIKVSKMGQISTEIFPGNPKISWQHLMSEPFVSDPLQPIKFVNANMHPDFTIAGEEIVRGWQANGGDTLDGVISIDSTALANVLEQTGPVATPGFGNITGENFKQRMLIDSYRQLSNEGQRQNINNLIGQALISRATSSQFPTVLDALLATAPGRHIQIHMQDVNLQVLISTLHLDGATPDKRAEFGSDLIGLYSKNRNQAKSDVFQKRQIIQHVVLHKDGSADIERIIKVKNDVPPGVSGEGTIGYTTVLNSSYWCSYLPTNAEDVTMLLPDGYPNMALYNNGYQSKLAFTRGGEIKPGAEVSMTLKYRLPAGFIRNERYSVAFGPQPIANPVVLTVTVEYDYGTKSGQIDTLIAEQSMDRYVELSNL
ncbi:MAG: DUF4012 domain-containing protein [Actinobacteria bacterium]|uniref:Unannotated protein n=1 Tax=freshwater metagenome TaxID=449393 RepID=A0A6J5Z5Z4_9ZZZZ|nr:DUF4012 domain-containing protein [Actinomycetota bacterium]